MHSNAAQCHTQKVKLNNRISLFDPLPLPFYGKYSFKGIIYDWMLCKRRERRVAFLIYLFCNRIQNCVYDMKYDVKRCPSLPLSQN